jgi:MFS family permease
VYFCIVSGNATIAFWSPSIIKEIGIQNNLQIGLISAIPFVAGTLAMVWNGMHSDKTGERRMHSAIAALIAATGLILTGMFLHNAVLALCALTLASVGILAAFPVFWSIPWPFWPARRAGIALINSIGNLAGFVAPYMIGALKTSTGSLSSGLYFVAALNSSPLPGRALRQEAVTAPDAACTQPPRSRGPRPLPLIAAMQLQFTTPEGQTLAPIFDTLIVAGWAGRDHAAIEHHIEELAALGIRAPAPCRCTTASPATS